MNTLGYGAERIGVFSISRLEDGIPLDARSPIDGILMSRLDFDVQIIDIPPVAGKEVEDLLRYRLRSLYPGNPEDTVFDYRIAQRGTKRYAIVFITQKQTVEKYRSAVGQKPLLLPYSLLARTASRKKNLRVWFVQANWAELSTFRDGILVSSIVRQREEEIPFDMDRVENSLLEDVRSLPVFIAGPSIELARIKENSGGKLPQEAVELSIHELSATCRKSDGLFNAKKQAPLLSPAMRISILALAAAVLAVLVFFKWVVQSERRYERLHDIYASRERESRRILAIQNEVDSLGEELARMQAQKPVDLYMLLSDLSTVLGTGVQIQSITIRENSFQVEAIGENPLKLMEVFRERSSFTGVKLSQVVPDSKLGKERFSFSGAFHAR